MRTDIKTKSSDYTDKSGNAYKKITTTTSVKVTVGDIIGTAQSAGDAISALKRKASDPTIKKTAVAGLISPLIAYASSMETVKSALKAASAVRKAINVAALASGTAFSPGNVGEIAQIGITAVKKILVALALNALATLKNFIWNYEIDLGSISNSTLVALGKKVEKNGEKINSKINYSLTALETLSDENADFSGFDEVSSVEASSTAKKYTKTNVITQINPNIEVQSQGSSTSTFQSSKTGTSNNFKSFTSDINFILRPQIRIDIVSKINDNTLSNTITPNSLTEEIILDAKAQVDNYLFDNPRNTLFGTPSYVNEVSPLRTVVSKDSIYKIHKLDSVIDWENDVGMQPIYPITLGDLVTSESTKEYIYDYNNIQNKLEYDYLIKETKNFLNSKLKTMQKNMGLLIDSTEMDVSDLVDSVDLADKRKIVDLAASFDDSQKIVSKQLANEYLMEILNLPENDIKEMIHMALYETEMNYYSQIKSFLLYLNEVLSANKMTKEAAIVATNEYNFYYDFSLGMSIAFYNYLKALSLNTKILNRLDDKNMIEMASTFYKQNERSVLIDTIKERVSYINPYEKDIDISSYYTSNMETIKDGLIAHINTSTWLTKNEFKEIIYNYIINNQIIVSDIEGSEERLEKVILKTKNRLFDNVENMKKELKFISFESFVEDFPFRMTLDDKIKTYIYLNEIHSKLLHRITELIRLSYDSVPLFTIEYLKAIINDEIKSSGKNMSSMFISNMNMYIDMITDETLSEQREFVNKRIEDMVIDIPSMGIVESYMFYYINGIKKYFVDNSGVL